MPLEIDHERVRVETVEEACKAYTEPAETLVHQLKVHEICFEIGHRVTELGELWFECIQSERRGDPVALRDAKGRS